jgi:hypothetical protein
MAENYILLERTELNASAASVTFSNIPQTGYTDLKIVVSARHSTTSADMYLSFNNLTTNLSDRVAYGLGASTVGSNAVSNIRLTINSGSSTANTFGNSEIYIPNYASAVAHSVSVDSVAEDNGTTNNIMWIGAGLWNSATAITSINLSLSTGNFAANSTFSLYGIAALGTTPVIAPKAIGGNIIDFDGTNWIHTFTSSGTFTPLQGLTCDYLVVAGGGGGGARRSGGGGAGGYQTSTLSVTATTYNVTVGAGGAGGGLTGLAGASGANSVFSSVTSTAGGGGGGLTSGNRNGSNGGSGGGASFDGTIGSASPSGQGNNGGLGASGSNPNNGGGGGGGAGGVGGNNPANGNGGTGGAGSSSSITGSAVIRAWGGVGGGFTNMGTAATGSQGNTAGASGTSNSGGGGNGTVEDAVTGGNGGSGVVVIKYPAA